MKVKSFVLLFLMLSAVQQSRGQILEINGTVEAGDGSGFVYFKKQLLPNQVFEVLDSVALQDRSTFSFKFAELGPGYYQLSYKDGKSLIAAPVLIDNVSINLQVVIDTTSFLTKRGRVYGRKIKLNGSKDNDLLDQYFEQRRYFYTNLIFPTEEKMRQIDIFNHSANDLDSLNNALRTYKAQMFEQLSEFLLQKMGTSIAVYQTMSIWDNTQHKFMLTVMEKFRAEKRGSFILPLMEEKYKQLVNTSLLQKSAPLFTLSGTDGNKLGLENYLGKKTILLDFWASWCGPCIKEMRGYRDALEKIEQKGILVISVSTDKRPDDWRKSLSSNKFPWIQLIDEGGTVAKQYGVLQLPTNFLINKEGVIIEKNVTLADLVR